MMFRLTRFFNEHQFLRSEGHQTQIETREETREDQKARDDCDLNGEYRKVFRFSVKDIIQTKAESHLKVKIEIIRALWIFGGEHCSRLHNLQKRRGFQFCFVVVLEVLKARSCLDTLACTTLIFCLWTTNLLKECLVVAVSYFLLQAQAERKVMTEIRPRISPNFC